MAYRRKIVGADGTSPFVRYLKLLRKAHIELGRLVHKHEPAPIDWDEMDVGELGEDDDAPGAIVEQTPLESFLSTLEPAAGDLFRRALNELRTDGEFSSIGPTLSKSRTVFREMYADARAIAQGTGLTSSFERQGHELGALIYELEEYSKGGRGDIVSLGDPAGDSGPVDGRAPPVNERMKAALSDNIEVADLTAREWGKLVGCAASTVVETIMWKTLEYARQQKKAERIEADRRNKI